MIVLVDRDVGGEILSGGFAVISRILAIFVTIKQFKPLSALLRVGRGYSSSIVNQDITCQN